MADLTIAVSIKDGHMTLTLIPASFCKNKANDLEYPTTACLLAEYIGTEP